VRASSVWRTTKHCPELAKRYPVSFSVWAYRIFTAAARFESRLG